MQIRVIVLVLLAAVLPAAAQIAPAGQDARPEDWIELFNGRNLDGWVIKISGFELGNNYNNTFRVEDGVMKTSYDQYETFGNHFGHIFYNRPFSYYVLSLEYRFVGEQAPDAPAWALRNSGAMLDSQAPETMTVDQDFPISIEAQLLGGNGTDPRPTMNLCTPGTNVVYQGKLHTTHCTNSTSKTYLDGQWVHVEAEVLGNRRIRHFVEGEMVLEYEQPQIGGGSVTNFDPEVKKDGTMLSGGYISLQSEGHPVEFRNVRVLPLIGCMEPANPAYRDYFVESDPAACQ